MTRSIILSVQALKIHFDNRSVIQNLSFDVDSRSADLWIRPPKDVVDFWEGGHTLAEGNHE